MNTISGIDLLVGILTITPIVIGYTMGIISLGKYLSSKKGMMLLSSILFFALPSPWIGTTIVFLGYLFDVAVSDTIYVFSYAWSVAVFSTVWSYITASFDQSKPRRKFYVLGILGTLSLFYFYLIYIAKEFEVHELEGTIFKDSTFTGITTYITYIFALFILFYVAVTYLIISRNTQDPIIRFKTRIISLGAVLFVFGAIADGIFGVTNAGSLIVIRFLIVLSLISLYLGYLTPNVVKEKIAAKE
ncbi:MAG: hypothetical protein INQ03_22245 [Candidatus Heimdallarchaeota archaeon]|nr:hypothetical protein [Candidatus Heimdallarchaeota archaeon]